METNKKLKIAFFGTSDKSTPIINELNSNFELSLCVTKTDTKVGRKQELREPAVKVWARDNSVPYLQVSSLKQDKEQVLEMLKEKEIELIIVCDFNFMIPKEIFEFPKYKTINIHFSLLPKYRGASPVQHTILNGDATAGVTFQLIAEGMDTGDIIYQFEHNLVGDETTEDLLSTLFSKSAKVVSKVIYDYTSNVITPQKQDESKAKYCYSKTNPKSTYIFKEDAKIDWSNYDLPKLYNMIRAFYPWPIVWTTLNEMEGVNISDKGVLAAKNANPKDKKVFKNKLDKDLRVKIYKATLLSLGEHKNELQIDEIQVEGKNKMNWKDFLNGYCET